MSPVCAPSQGNQQHLSARRAPLRQRVGEAQEHCRLAARGQRLLLEVQHAASRGLDLPLVLQRAAPCAAILSNPTRCSTRQRLMSTRGSRRSSSRGMPRSHYPAHTLGPFSLLPPSVPLLGLVGRLAGPRLDEQLPPDAQRDLEPRGERVRADCAASLRTTAPGSFAMGGRAARRYGQALGPPLRAPAPGLRHAPRAAPSSVGARTHRARQRPFRRGAAESAPARAPLAPTPARRRRRRRRLRRRRRRRRRSPST